MNVTYICADPGVPVFGRKGCSVHVQEIVRALGQLGCTLDVFACRYDGSPPTDLTDVTYHRLPAPSKEDAAMRERAALDANHDLRVALHRHGPFDLIYERYSLWSFAGMEFAREAGIPGLLEVNAPLIDEQATHRTLINRFMAERVARQTFAAANRLIAVSNGVASYLRHFDEAQGKVIVVPNGVNPVRFTPGQQAASARAPDRVTIGFVGTLKPWHGVECLIAAFARLRQAGRRVRLLIVGDGPERSRLESDIAGRGLSADVLFTGAVDPDAVPAWLTSMDIAVAPYPARDDFYFSPLKVFESMAAGLPVVASRIGQVRDVIHDGVNGRLYLPGDVAELSAVLDELVAAPDLCNRLGRAARSVVLRRHTWLAVADRILTLAGLNSSPPVLAEAVS